MENESNFKSAARMGITLIDLVVFLLITSLFFGIAMPVLVGIRSNSREVKCTERLKVIGKATIEFHDSQKRLPPGVLGHKNAPKWTSEYLPSSSEFSNVRCQNTSSFGLLMPFLEMEKEHSKIHKIMFDMDRFLDENKAKWFRHAWETPGVLETIQIKPEIFTCPADELNKTNMPVAESVHPAVHDDKYIKPTIPLAKGTGMAATLIDVEKKLRAIEFNGTKKFWNKLNRKFEKPLGRTNFLANVGAYSGGRIDEKELFQFEGPMSTRRKVAYKNVKDGTSTTVMFGETVGEIKKKKRMWSQGWFTAGLGRGRGNLDWKNGPDKNTKSIFGDMEQAPGAGFGSAHKDIVNFVFVDGSNHAFVRSMDWEVAYAMFGMADKTKWDSGSKFERKVETDY